MPKRWHWSSKYLRTWLKTDMKKKSARDVPAVVPEEGTMTRCRPSVDIQVLCKTSCSMWNICLLWPIKLCWSCKTWLKMLAISSCEKPTAANRSQKMQSGDPGGIANVLIMLASAVWTSTTTWIQVCWLCSDMSTWLRATRWAIQVLPPWHPPPYCEDIVKVDRLVDDLQRILERKDLPEASHSLISL